MEDALGGHVTTRVSAGGHSALVSGAIGRPFSTDALRASVAGAGGARITSVLDDHSGGSGSNDLSRAERLSLPVTLLVLLIAFGALVAAVVPVVLGATAVIAAFGLLGPISQVFPLDSSVETVVLLIGMAVGVDYALFYVIRSREERARGLASHDALARTTRTSGHTVLVAGTTVAIAMAGQFMIGTDIFNGIAAGTIAVIACAFAGSVTVLPAVVELLGLRIDRGRMPFFRTSPTSRTRASGRRSSSASCAARSSRSSPRSRCWWRPRSPRPGCTCRSRARTSSRRRSDHRLRRGSTTAFPGCAPPAIVVFAWPPGERAAAVRAADRLEQLAAARGIAHPPLSTAGSLDGGAGNARAAAHRHRRRRRQQARARGAARPADPADARPRPGTRVAVTGETARNVDFTRQMTHGLPYVIAFVLVLALLILLFTFRSLVIPIKAIVLNLLSVAASCGVLVLVFQYHWAESLLGFHSTGWIISWLPVFLFVVLFGLSMDYHVFILSRVREGIDSGMSNEKALRFGIARTAGVVTSAALVMLGVFSLFATANAIDLKQAGAGLAVAVTMSGAAQ